MSTLPTPSRDEPILDRRIVLLAVASLLLFLVALSWPVEPEKLPEPTTAGAGAFSRSAVGHRALVAALRRLELPVLVERGAGIPPLDHETLLLLPEPDASSDDAMDRFRRLLSAGIAARAFVVVVLPKWKPIPDPARPGWVRSLEMLPVDRAERCLEEIFVLAPTARPRVIRPERLDPAGWHGVGGDPPELPAPQLLELPGGDGGRLQPLPLVRHEAGALVVQATPLPVYVIADPDLLDNAGLRLGGNAAFVLGFFTESLGVRRVVLDEGIHGIRQVPSPWRALLRPPLLLATLEALLLLSLVFFVSAGRFGRPVPAAGPSPPRGSAGLAHQAARLLARVPVDGKATLAWFELLEDRLARHFRLPPTSRRERHALLRSRLAGSAAGADWERLAGAARLLASRPGVRERELLSLCRDAHRVYKEIVDGRS